MTERENPLAVRWGTEHEVKAGLAMGRYSSVRNCKNTRRMKGEHDGTK